MTNLFKKVFLGLLSVSFLCGLAYALDCGSGGLAVERYTVTGASGDTEIFCLDASGNINSTGTIVSSGEVAFAGGINLGNSTSSPTSAPTSGASGTGNNFGIKVPYVNASGATISAGAVVLASATVAGGILAPGTISAVTSTTTWVGINESSLASGSTGYMIVGGYAMVLTTGTVAIGDLVTSSASVAGYGGMIAGGTSVLEGSVIGKAMANGTAAGGLTLIRVGN